MSISIGHPPGEHGAGKSNSKDFYGDPISGLAREKFQDAPPARIGHTGV
jgi:hypothetical protein